MAISPGSDLLSDALLAADPLRAQAAAGRLSALAAGQAGEAAAAQPFEEALKTQEAALAPSSAATAAPLAVMHGQPLTSAKAATPYEQFEAAMLTSFFEAMIPSSRSGGVYGSGFAGEMWKSMMAQSLAAAVSHTNTIGVARELEERAHRAKS